MTDLVEASWNLYNFTNENGGNFIKSSMVRTGHSSCIPPMNLTPRSVNKTLLSDHDDTRNSLNF